MFSKSKGMVVLSYIKGLSKRMTRAMRTHNISTAYKLCTTLRNILVHPKDKIEQKDICGCIYKIGCKSCDNAYIGETGRKFGVRLAEHKKYVDEHSRVCSNQSYTSLLRW